MAGQGLGHGSVGGVDHDCIPAVMAAFAPVRSLGLVLVGGQRVCRGKSAVYCGGLERRATACSAGMARCQPVRIASRWVTARWWSRCASWPWWW
jgi:hypothetical protein